MTALVRDMRPRPRLIDPLFREMIWGTTNLKPWFPDSPRPVGEIWFTSTTLLTKFLFTAQPLSVQVHPTDEYAGVHENSCGKSEMWIVLRAGQGARIGLGLKQEFDKEQVREAAVNGRIEEMMQWVPVSAGDVLACESGTIHALGEGLTLLEIQQKADITYRLYDYGRGRELQLDKALDVAHLGPHPAQIHPTRLGDGMSLLMECKHFRVERAEFQETTRWPAGQDQEEVWVCIGGSGWLRDAALAEGGSIELRPGVVCALPEGTAPFFVVPQEPLQMIRAWVPRRQT